MASISSCWRRPPPEQRIRKIAEAAKGYLYVVSSMGVTGMRREIRTDLKSIIETARKASDVPVAVGFGINTPEQAKEIGNISDGVIVGSAIVKIIEKYGEEAGPYLYEYVKSMKDVLSF